MEKQFRSDVDRAKLLVEINKVLAEKGHKQLTKLGKKELGEIEIVGLEQVFDHGFFLDLKVKVIFPSGKEGHFYPRFNGGSAKGDGAVLFPVINGKVAIVKQWRLPLCRWTYELPRGFSELMDSSKAQGTDREIQVSQLPLGTVSRELGEEVMAGAKISGFTYLGDIAQDSGYHTASPSYFMVNINVDPGVLEGKLKGSGEDEVSAVQLWQPQEVWNQIGRKIRDGHSVTCAALARRALEDMPRFG